MSDDIVSRVGGAILLAETEWTPRAGVSKERAMALAAIEAMREPTEAMKKDGWEANSWFLAETSDGSRTRLASHDQRGAEIMIPRLLLHLALHVPYVPFRPWILGLAIGRMPRKVGTSDAGNDSLKRALERGT